MDNSQKKVDKTDPTNSEKENKKANVCPICFEPIVNLCRTDQCDHEFCFQCLRNWIRHQNVCPICRQIFDYILYNFRTNPFQFDAIPVDNRESRVRRSLFRRRDTLRQNLMQLSEKVDREIEAKVVTRSLITDCFSRIDQIERQNNDQMGSTLDEIKNVINEMNVERVLADGPPPALPAIRRRTPNVPIASVRQRVSRRIPNSVSLRINGRAIEYSEAIAESMSIESSSSSSDEW